MRRRDLSECPGEYFIKDLVHFITKIIHENCKVVLAADINKHSIKEKLPKELKRIGMVESFTRKHQVASLASHAKGSNLIDRASVVKDLALEKVSILPQSFRVGVLRVMLINLNVKKILEHSMRRLISKNLTSVENYNNLALELLKSNKMP